MSEAPSENPKNAELAAQSPKRKSFSLFRRAGGQAKDPEQELVAAAARPRREKRREGLLSRASGFLSFLLVASAAGALGYGAALHKLGEAGPLTAEKVVIIPARSDVPEILAQLEREGVIDSPTLMNGALLVERARGFFVERAPPSRLVPGEYSFKARASLREVMDEMASGRVVLHAITIPEGLTSEQIVQRLRESNVLGGDVKELPKEGALLPETYKVARGYLRAKLIAKMQEDQRKLLDKIWARRAADLPLKTPFELITLASIVEKETGRADERARVAGAFVNRLRKGMRLQSDPTIVYGLVGGKATLGRGILKSEVEKWTPYNTYAIDGLPPGPIANPGKAALEAAANPRQTQELYFVADGSGGHAFAATLEEHARNVQHWRQVEREAKESAGAKSPPLDIDRAEPEVSIAPPQQKGREKKSDAAPKPIGRLAMIGEGSEDDPPRGFALPANKALRRGAAWAAAPVAPGAGPRAAILLDFARNGPFEQEQPLFSRILPQERPGLEALLLEPPAGDGVAADETEDSQDAGGITIYPASPKAAAEQKARAARLSLPEGGNEPPVDALGDLASAEGATAASPATPPARPRAFDASEGTPLDPLRDRSWDLTSAKTVPAGLR